MMAIWNDTKIRYLEASSPEFCKRRRFIIILMILRFVVYGIQNTIFLPSLWPYLKMFQSPRWFYGIVASVSNISAIFTMPVVGMIYDKTKRIKEMTISFTIVDIIGNILYSLPLSCWFPFSGRIIMGVAIALSPATFAEMALITDSKKRLAAMVWAQFGLFTGLASGPTFTLFFTKIHFHLGQLIVDYRNAPGVFIALVWCIMLVLNQILLTNVAKDFAAIDCGDINFEEEAPSLNIDGEKSASINVNVKKDREPMTLFETLTTMFAWEICSVHFATFLLSLLSKISNTLTPLITEDDLGWNTTQTALLFGLSAIVALTSTLIVRTFSQKIKELSLIYIGLAALVVTAIFLISYEIEKSHSKEATILYVVGFTVSYFCLPLEIASSNSLLSTVVPNQCQGLMQSTNAIRRRIAGVLGPCLGVFMYNYLIIGSVGIIFCCWLAVVLLRFSSNKLKMRKLRYTSEE